MKILVTAGPTQEPIDPVRFISNRSSGKMGYALARSAARRGHDVILISGPVHITPPTGIGIISIKTAEQMFSEVLRNLEWCDALIMAAAVADWRPKAVISDKIKKNEMPMRLELEPTPDILCSVSDMKGDRIFVGFAAETRCLEEEAIKKLRSKKLDMIVANDVSEPGSGFDADTNRVTLITPDGATKALPLISKDEVADNIIEWTEQRKSLKAEQQLPSSCVCRCSHE